MRFKSWRGSFGVGLLAMLASLVAHAENGYRVPTYQEVFAKHERSQTINDPLGLRSTSWGEIARAKGVDVYVLYAVALKESKRQWGDGLMRPWPYAVRANQKPHYPTTREQAIKILASADRVTTDLCAMQINLRWHGHRVDKAEQLLDPLTCLRVGATILAETIASAPGDLELGVGRYHNWKPAVARAYGSDVLRIAMQLKYGH